MTPRRSEQEWQTLIQQCEESTLSTKEFCRQSQLTTSTLYSKKKQRSVDKSEQSGGFVRAKIQKLYALESRIKGFTAAERLVERQAHAIPLLDDLSQWLSKQKVVSSSLLGKAIEYAVGQWPKLIRYVDDGHLSIDNNQAERAIKPLVIGRKNWLFSNPPKGAGASAMLYSIIETVKANDLIMYDYLVKCMKELAKSAPDIESLLAWNCTH